MILVAIIRGIRTSLFAKSRIAILCIPKNVPTINGNDSLLTVVKAVVQKKGNALRQIAFNLRNDMICSLIFSFTNIYIKTNRLPPNGNNAIMAVYKKISEGECTNIKTNGIDNNLTIRLI